MIFSDMAVFTCQVTAALMMGWDYLMPSTKRELLNSKLRQYFAQVQTNVDKSIILAWQDLISNIKPVIISIILSLSGYHSFNYISGDILVTYPILTSIALVIAMICFVGGSLFLVNLLCKLIVPFCFGGMIFRVLTTFLLMTEKGPFAGIGFIILLISFVMRYKNIVN